MPFTIERNDLSKVAADAIVVAANERLLITGGVGLTVAMEAGLKELQAACSEIGFCPCGSAVATPAFGLQAKIVVHAVGPIWRGGNVGEADFLRSAYDAALECAVSNGAASIALPLISAGTYGFPSDVSLAVARESIRSFLNRNDDVLVRLVLYSRESVTAGMAAYLDIAEYVDDYYVDEHPAWGTVSPFSPNWQEAPSSAEPLAQSRPKMAQSPQGPIGRLASAMSERRQRRKGKADEEARHAAETMQVGAAFPKADYSETSVLEEGFASAEASVLEDVHDANLTQLLNSLDAPFSTTLLALIDERGMTDAQVYKRANMSRQLFSKIRSDSEYRPSKKTVLALAVALGLDLDETAVLLARAGFALSTSSKADVIVRYFISRGNYDIFEINEALYAFDQPLL